MEDKFNMSMQQNIFVAKRNIVDYIWKSAKIEGINVTYPETEEIYNGGNIAHLRVDEIVAINNLKNAWKFILNTVENSELDFNYLCSIHSLVGNSLVEGAGNLRYSDVKIGGTNYRPPIPEKEDFINDINNILNDNNISETEIGINLMCYIVRAQPFFDGNKRTSMLFANAYLIKKGRGIISVSDDKRLTFGEYLTEYYDTGDNTNLKNWLYDNALEGIDFSKEEHEEE